MTLNESIVEAFTLEWFGELGYAGGHGPHLPASEQTVHSAWIWHSATT